MKKLAIIVLLLVLAAVPLLGQNVTKVGTTAASFLNIDAGARGVGMGGAFVSVADDISSMYWNPAGLARMKQGEASFSNTRWIADIAYNYAGVAVPVGQIGTVGLNAAFLTMDEMLRTTVADPDGAGNETFSAGSYAFGLTYAKNLTDRFSIGFNFKYINERIWHTRWPWTSGPCSTRSFTG
jgi:long-subunit fatty acid transport protein